MCWQDACPELLLESTWTNCSRDKPPFFKSSCFANPNALQSRSISKGTLSLQLPHAKYLHLHSLAPAVGKTSKPFFTARFWKAPCLKLQGPPGAGVQVTIAMNAELGCQIWGGCWDGGGRAVRRCMGCVLLPKVSAKCKSHFLCTCLPIHVCWVCPTTDVSSQPCCPHPFCASLGNVTALPDRKSPANLGGKAPGTR